MPLTLEETITEVEILLAQHAGPSVQKYAGERISKFIQQAFDVLFTEDWWPQFNWWQVQALNGTTGFATNDSEFASFMDLKAIYPENENRRLSRLPFPFNPFLMQNTTAVFVDPQAGPKLFRIWPLNAVGNIYVQGRKKPAKFSLDEEIDFDEVCLQSLAAWKYAVDDGNNPMQAEKLQAIYDQRLKKIKGEILGNIPIDFDPRFAAVPTQWTELPS
jgi:hypothetical protein